MKKSLQEMSLSEAQLLLILKKFQKGVIDVEETIVQIQEFYEVLLR